MKDLENKVVLITGAAGGLGLETAKAFAKKGSTVVAADIDEDRLERALVLLQEIKPECRAYAVDLTSAESVEEMAARIIEIYGGVDVIVNVAGVVMLADFIDSPLKKWKWVVEGESGIVTTRGIGTANFVYKYMPALFNLVMKGVRSGMSQSKRMLKV